MHLLGYFVILITSPNEACFYILFWTKCQGPWTQIASESSERAVPNHGPLTVPMFEASPMVVQVTDNK